MGRVESIFENKMDKCSIISLVDKIILKDNWNLSSQSRILMRNQIMEKTENKISDLIFLLTYLFVVIANTLRIVGINKTKNNNNNYERSVIKNLFYLTSLLGVLNGILATITIFGKVFAECDIEFIALGLGRIVMLFDFFVLLCIGIVRFISFRYPFKEIKRKWILLTLGLYLLYITCLTFYGILLKYMKENRKLSHYKILALFIVLCMTLNCFSVFIVQYTLLKGSKNNEHLNNQSIERQRKAVKRLTLINGVYLVFNLPYVIYLLDLTFILDYATAEATAWRIERYYYLYYFSFLYSGISALIYIMWDKDIVKFYKEIIQKMRK